MSPRRKRKDKGGLQTLERTTATAQSHAATKTEARVPGRSHMRRDLGLLPPSSPDVAEVVQLPTDDPPRPSCPPAKRPRCYVQFPQEKHQEKQHQDTVARETADSEKHLSCVASSTVSVACCNSVCSAGLRCEEDIASATSTQEQPSANACLQNNDRRTSTDLEDSSLDEEAVCVSELSEVGRTPLNTGTGGTGARCSLRASCLKKLASCAMAGVSAPREIFAGAASKNTVSPVNSAERNHQDDLLACAQDTLSQTKKLLALEQSGKGKECCDHTAELRVEQDNDSEKDVKEAAGKHALLLTGRTPQPTLLHSRQDSLLASTLTPRLQLNPCCSIGVRTPPAGSPLSMSSQASTNSAFSSSPLTCCSSVGPSSLPATPSCWLSDEHSPHQTQKHSSDAASPARAAVPRQVQQQDGSAFLWEVVSSCTPMRSDAAGPSSAVAAERSRHSSDAEEGCSCLLSLSPGPSARPCSCGRVNTPGYQERVAGGNNAELVASRTTRLPEPAAAENATQVTISPPALTLPAGSPETVGSAGAATTDDYAHRVWNRGDTTPQNGLPVERSERIVTQEHELQKEPTLGLKSNSEACLFVREESIETPATTFREPGQCKAPSGGPVDTVQDSSTIVECATSCENKAGREAAGEDYHPACRTSVCSRSPKPSAGPSSTADRTVATAAAIPLPLQLPIPARAPRGKAHSGQLGRQQQLADQLCPPAFPAAAAVTEDSCAAASAEDSAFGQEAVTVEVAGDSAEAPERTAEVRRCSGERDADSKSSLLPTLLTRGGSSQSMSVSDTEVKKRQEGTSRCRLQLPADRRSFESHGHTQQQQAAALTAMERAAVRAKLAARAAAACAAVIDAAAAAARNASAVCAAIQDSAGTAAGDYTEYPDLQRSIHDDYDLFCNAAPGAAAFLQGTACSSSNVASRDGARGGSSQQFWRPLSQVRSATEPNFVQQQTCHANAEERVVGPGYWPDMSRSSARRSSSGTATSDSRSSSNSRTSTRCTDRQSSRGDVIALGDDAAASAPRCRCCSDGRGIQLKPCGLRQREDSHWMARDNNEAVGSDCQSQRLPRCESCTCLKCCDSEAEPPRDGVVDEANCPAWAADGLITSRHCLSRSSSMGTDVSRYTVERRSSRCTRCWCCRSCSLTECSSLASSPRCRLEHQQKAQWNCDSLPGSNHAAVLCRTTSQQDASVASPEDNASTSVREETTALGEPQKAADREEKQVEAEHRDSTKSMQENSKDEGTASRQTSSEDSSSGYLPGSENSTVAFSAELLETALASLEEAAEDTLKTDVPTAHDSLQTVPALAGPTEDAPPTTAECQMGGATENSRRHVVLGAGRFGKVVLGHHNHSDLLVAVKIIDKSRVRAACSEDDEVNFRQEIEMHRRLPAHRNIVTVYDVYEDRKCMYLVMELCDRISLLDKLAEEGPLHEDLARQIFLQILAAVKHCHDHHVVHRDLKPENVLFARPQQPPATGRQPSSCKSPSPAPVHHCCGAGHPTGCKTASAACMCLPCCCCGSMPHGDSGREKPSFGHPVHCRFSSTRHPARRQTSICCCTYREIEHTCCCCCCSTTALDLRYGTGKGNGNRGVTGPATQGSSYVCVNEEQCHGVRSHQWRAAAEGETTAVDASGHSEDIGGNATQQHCLLQQDDHVQQSYSRGIQQLSEDRDGALQQQRPAVPTGNPAPEAAPWCDSEVVEATRSAESHAVPLRNPRSSSEGGMNQDIPPNLLAAAGCCCCCRCGGHEEDVERDTQNNHLLSLHMWKRDRQEPPTVKLIDFGAACSSARGQLRGTACGTTHYVCPPSTANRMR